LVLMKAGGLVCSADTFFPHRLSTDNNQMQQKKLPIKLRELAT